MAATYRKLRRGMMLAALVGLLAVTAAAGLWVGLALVAAFVVGVAFVGLNVLEAGETEVDRAEEAVKLPYVRVDQRTVDDPAKLKHEHNWYEKGRNHRIINGYISRDFDAEAWFVELNTLEELLAFQDIYGEIIIGGANDSFEYLRIEIYDDYRE